MKQKGKKKAGFVDLQIVYEAKCDCHAHCLWVSDVLLQVFRSQRGDPTVKTSD